MNNLLKLINYIYDKYPKLEELSKPRLVKLIYLIDWKYAIDNGHQFTEIRWYFNHYGPYVDDVINLIKSQKDYFVVKSYNNIYGNVSDKISRTHRLPLEIDENVKSAADFIINNTFALNWSDFISVVYSSFPIKNNSQYTYLDLQRESENFRDYRQKIMNK